MKRENIDRVTKIIQELNDIDRILEGLKAKDLGITINPNVPGVWLTDWMVQPKVNPIEQIAADFLYDYLNYHLKQKEDLLKELESL